MTLSNSDPLSKVCFKLIMILKLCFLHFYHRKRNCTQVLNKKSKVWSLPSFDLSKCGQSVWLLIVYKAVGAKRVDRSWLHSAWSQLIKRFGREVFDHPLSLSYNIALKTITVPLNWWSFTVSFICFEKSFITSTVVLLFWHTIRF